MKIFDGVELKPTLSPTMQGALSWVLLIANTLVEAGNCRNERLGHDTKRPTTLGQVMQESGLQIPGLEEALVQIMGGGEEAKQAASLIVSTPDPAALLQKFAQQFGLKVEAAAKTEAHTPPPPAASPAASPPPPPATNVASGPPTFREDFTREAREAAKAASDPVPPPKFRADFTREAREAAKVAAHATSSPPSTPVARPSLVEMVEHQLGALRRKMEAHEAEIKARLGRAESELAALRARFHELVAAKSPPRLHVVEPQVEEPSAPLETDSEVAATPVSDAEVSPDAVVEPLPVAATEEDVVRAVELIGAFGDEVDTRHQQSIARLAEVENEIRVMRVLVEREESEKAATVHA